MIVVDASLAAKWLFEEAGSGAALAFLRRHAGHLAAPDLIGVEVAGGIVRRANMKELKPDGAAAGLAAWLDLVQNGALEQFAATSARLETGVQIALQISHPLKDCIYLALAIELGCALATCDARFADRARSLYADVKILSDFDFPDTPRRLDA